MLFWKPQPKAPNSLEEAIGAVLTGLDQVVARTGVGTARNAVALKALSTRIDQAFEGMEHMATAASQIQQGVEKVATEAGNAAQRGEQVDRLAQSGYSLGLQASQANQNLNHQVHDMARHLDALSGRVVEITQVSGVINEIAEQTKMLALNAAIEASHAREHGRGFAVVAAEVKKLADHAWQQTSVIDALVAEISAQLQSVQTSVSQSGELVDIASGHMEGLGRSLEEIRQLAGDSAQNMQEVAVAVAAQTTQMVSLSDSSRHTAEGIRGIQTEAERVVRATEELQVVSEGAYQYLRQVPTDTPFNRALVLLQGLARDAQAIFEQAVRQNQVTLEDILEFHYVEYKGAAIQGLSRLFDVSRVPREGFNPPKFGTPYDALVDEALGRLIDGLLEREPWINTATLIDLNGYIPMHPTKVCQAWTGDYDRDLAQNRCKKFYLGASLRGARVGLAQAEQLPERVERAELLRRCDLSHSAAAAEAFLVQTYSRDTGEAVALLTVPLFVMGQRFGAATATWKAD